MSRAFSMKLISAIRLTKSNSPDTCQSYGKRIAKYYELELITEGSGAIITDGKILKTIGGRLFIRRPGMKLEGFTPYHSYFITFSDTGGELEQMTFPLYLDHMEFLTDTFKSIRKNFLYPDNASDLEIQACILKIMAEVLRDSRQHIHPAIDYSVKYIQSHLEDPLTVSLLAQLSGYSLNHYINLFKIATGVTPSEFIRDCRIQRACELLEETNHTVEAISQVCGFGNLSYFFRSFKKMRGQTPHEYRKGLQSYRGLKM